MKSQGLKLIKGDALSPFLFLIALEGLKCVLDKARDLELIKGVFILDKEDNLSLLQFLDDTLIFIPANLEKLKNL